jgi:magnesium-transporting ATPase (P-type)
MIVPALAVEGTDAFDAIQRCYAYVIGRPLRYLTYLLILTLLGTFAAALFAMLARVSIEMTDWAAGFLANDATQRALTGEGDLGATKKWAHEFISYWRNFVEILIAGYIISLFFTSATLLYLAVRRICDGQGITEIWEPVAGTED